MKVKIMKSDLPTFWYADSIGEVFEVENFSPINYKVIGSLHTILKSDCEIIEEPKRLMFSDLTARDYFAAKAMQANIDIWDWEATYERGESLDETYMDIAKDSYRQADAMLKAREAK